MIQTVSLRRVLPPVIIKNGQKYRDVSYSQRIISADIKQLEAATTAAVGYGDYQSIRAERNQLRLDSQQLTKQLEQIIEELETHKRRTTENENQKNAVRY